MIKVDFFDKIHDDTTCVAVAMSSDQDASGEHSHHSSSTSHTSRAEFCRKATLLARTSVNGVE